jgi:hypothetical protein
MLKRLAALALTTACVSFFACANERDAEDPSMVQGQYGQQPGYPQQQPGQYGQQPGYPQQQPGVQPGMQPGQAPMAQPNPMSPACQSDAQCITAKCNMQYGKCQLPCTAATDCQPGNQCTLGACVPGLPGVTPPAQ